MNNPTTNCPFTVEEIRKMFADISDEDLIKMVSEKPLGAFLADLVSQNDKTKKVDSEKTFIWLNPREG